MRRSSLLLIAFLALSLWSSSIRAAEVLVAVAANFGAPMRKIAQAFESQSGHTATLALGATGAFAAQIRNGAPFDVLLAADEETPARLEKEGLALAGSRFTYAIGRLALWSARENYVGASGEVLARGDFAHIAIANPMLSPYGQAAVETMQRMGVYGRLAPRIVQGENISQAFQFVATDSVPLGFVALSQVQVDGKVAKGSAWVVPAQLHAPLRQDAVLLARARGNAAAAALVDFLKGEKARGIIRAYGYELQ